MKFFSCVSPAHGISRTKILCSGHEAIDIGATERRETGRHFGTGQRANKEDVDLDHLVGGNQCAQVGGD